MSVPLKPLTVEHQSKLVDAKQKKFEANIEYALQYFDSVSEWADYIANLGKLLKVLQSWSPQFQNVKYYVPSPYQVSRRLTSSLSPSLPAGVHQKTLEVYTYIFDKIGIEALSAECNIWIPGILPLMTYASMSVKAQLIELYDTYLVQLNKQTIKIIIKPLIASLLPGIDDDSSEFQPLVFKLIETVRERLDDDALFWKTCFSIVITNKDHRLGGIILFSRKLPSLNAIPHKKASEAKEDQEKRINIRNLNNSERKERSLATLLPDAKAIVKEEPGLLVRAFVSCMRQENDVLIKRGILDLMVQRLHLNSPVIQQIVSIEDKNLLLLECCKIMLSKDMSLNRRIWSWLLGPMSSHSGNRSSKVTDDTDGKLIENKDDQHSNKYFITNGLDSILASLNYLNADENSLPISFNICISLLERYEISSHIIPKMFLPLMLSSMKFQNNEQVIAVAKLFFNSIDTKIIWSENFRYLIKSSNFEYLSFLLETFDFSTDEELMKEHLPLILLFVFEIIKNETTKLSERENLFNIIEKLLITIPADTYCSISNIDTSTKADLEANKIVEKISNHYNSSSQSLERHKSDNPDINSFSIKERTTLIYWHASELLISSLGFDRNVPEALEIYLLLIQKLNIDGLNLPESGKNYYLSKLSEIVKLFLENEQLVDRTVYSINNFFIKYLSPNIGLFESNIILKKIVHHLWKCLLTSNSKLEAVKCIETLEKSIYPGYIEEQLAYSLIEERDIANKIFVMDLLWNHISKDTTILNRSLDLLLDYLFDTQGTYYLYISHWLQQLDDNGSIIHLYEFMISKLLKFEFLKRSNLNDLDDLDVYTYQVQCLTNILQINGGKLSNAFCAKTTKQSLKNESNDSTTYKSLTITILIQLLKMNNNNHVGSVRSSLALLDILLSGKENDFKETVIFLLEMSANYGSQGNFESESIAVSLINIVSKVLHTSQANAVKLDIFEDNSIHMKYLDYLVTSVPKMEGPLIISAYVKLLLESFAYFENSIFRIIVPLSGSIIECIQILCSNENQLDRYTQSIFLLLNGLEKLLMKTFKKLIPTEADGFFSAATVRTDFLQNMVNNVFVADNSSSKKAQGEQNALFQSFKQILHCCIDLWGYICKSSGKFSFEKSPNLSTYNSKILKNKVTQLIHLLFELEPIETIEGLTLIKDSSVSSSLLKSLTSFKAINLSSYFLYDITVRCNKAVVVQYSVNNNNSANINKISRNELNYNSKLTTESLVDFFCNYILSFADYTNGDFLSDLSIFFKYSYNNHAKFENILIGILQMYAVISQKIQEGEADSKMILKKELSDSFSKFIPHVNDIKLLKKDEVASKEYTVLSLVLSNLENILNEKKDTDKFQNILTIIISSTLQTAYKNQNFDSLPQEFYLLSIEFSKLSKSGGLWDSLIQDTFSNDKTFKSHQLIQRFSPILLLWSNYTDNKSKLINNLLTISDSMPLAIGPSVISFNSWNYSEIDLKFLNMLRISYLILINKNDYYLMNFPELIDYCFQCLLSHEVRLKTTCWILLRILLFKFSATHFNDHWALISYCLQTNLQDYYEKLKIQEEIDATNVLHIAKTLDLLLLFNFEEFSSTNEWVFIIDTVNCISKESPFISLCDIISESKEYKMMPKTISPIKIAGPVNSLLLLGINNIDSHYKLKDFFANISYFHYEYVYSLKDIQYETIEEDLLQDIFWA